MAPPKTIRALERGLHIIQILRQQGPSTLNDIFQVACLPRPTILRVLRTLEGSGWIRRGLGDGLYRNSFKIGDMVDGLDQTDRLAEIAAPYLDALCRKVSWPSDLAVLNSAGLHMELKETSRTSTPFQLNHDAIGHLINLPLSAVGRVYLAFCSDAEREFLIAKLKKSNDMANKIVYQEASFFKTLTEIRQAGYATRETSFGGGRNPLKSHFDDGLNAVAVPISTKKEILGCITLVWIRKAAPVQYILTEYLSDLQIAAKNISGKLEN